ncbi:hypothetical protein G3M48_004668 [Beauveria asiatica]|uniref:Uncharacterized protein n=1 Tax=Beauveria asiatica TaxID=1069075 RepID=A0AAW0RST0_9HYPO
MKASAAIFAVTACASAQTLRGPSISAGPLSVPSAASPVFTQSPNMTSTSASTRVTSRTQRPLEWAPFVPEDASASETSTGGVHPEEHPAADPAATLRIQEHQDVLRTMTKATRTTQGEQPFKTPNPAGTLRGEEIVDILRSSTDRKQETKTEPLVMATILSALWTEVQKSGIEQVMSKMSLAHSREVNRKITKEGKMTTSAVATPTWEDVESRPTVERLEEASRPC